MPVLRPEDHDRLNWQHQTYAKEEVARRQKAPIHVPAEDTEAQYAQRGKVYVIDPRLGFNHRSFRFWVSAHLPDKDVKKKRTLGHRHNIEAVIFILQGHGYSVVDGVRYDWEPGDFICVPIFAWHRHVCTSDELMVYTAATTGPLGMALGTAIYEDDRHPELWVFAQESEESAKTLIPGGTSGTKVVYHTEDSHAPLSPMDTLYGQQLSFAGREEKTRRAHKVLVKGKEIKLEKTRMGHVAYVVDPKVGFYSRVLGSALAEMPPGAHSGAHRHLYEEVNYVLRGRGYSIIEDRRIDWKAGDTLCIPVFGWHQHFNNGDEPARFLIYHNRPFMENLGHLLVQQGEEASRLDVEPDNRTLYPVLDRLKVDPNLLKRRAEQGRPRFE
jgi:gentisate 1,2-dioxygenase